MATVVIQHQPPFRQTTPPLTPALSLQTTRSRTPVPNKHIPFCPPGPIPSPQQITPPNSPPSRNATIKPYSLLYPPSPYQKLCNSPSIYGIEAKALADVLDYNVAQPLPNPSSVFPWLHGLHPDNHIQLAFFVARKRSLRKVPKQIRAITIIKAGGDLSRGRIKGALAPDEVLSLCDDSGRGFLDCDPREGFSVRNFHIQTAKVAQVSDIIVYGDSHTDTRIIKSVAERAALVQKRWRKDLEHSGQMPETYNTFVLTDPFEDFERLAPQHVAVDLKGKVATDMVDFLQQERKEMCTMSKASEISTGVYLGPSPDIHNIPEDESSPFDLFIEANDHAAMLDERTLSAALKQLEDREGNTPLHLAFPSSGSILPPSWSQSEVDGILQMCKWLYHLTHHARRKSVAATKDEDGDIQMTEFSDKPYRVLIHCADGYTETTLLGVAYFMFSTGLPVHEAWVQLHRDKGRNFFAYPTDVALLLSIQERLLAESPAAKTRATRRGEIVEAPSWVARLDGSLPSRVLPYMYLGNLTHANNPDLLKLLGIKRILSVGEPVQWSKGDAEAWGSENLLMVDKVQDNGIDELGVEIERCLDFIGKGRDDGTATLVHCRVGVSRSATICIAEVMRSSGMSFPRAYCFVRARRLNVIIQPHLRFVYELMKWDEIQQEARQMKNGKKVEEVTLNREMEWASVCREIAAMNRPYARS